MAIPGSSGKDKLASLMQFIKSDRAERHVAKGRDFVEQKDWENAKKEFEDALTFFQELEAWPRAAQMLSSLALCYCALHDYDRASDHLSQAIALYQKLGDEEGEATGQLGIGEVLLDKGDNEGALAAFQKALGIFARNQIYDGVTYAYRGMERVYRATGEKEKEEEARYQSEDARRKLTTAVL
jgi:tetratricopeptide (TPR) repeat protein